MITIHAFPRKVKKRNEFVATLTLDDVYDLLPHSRIYILGKEIAYSNVLSLLRIIRQTTQYSIKTVVRIDRYGRPSKIITEVISKPFPKISIYTNPDAIEVRLHRKKQKKNSLSDAYVPVNYKKGSRNTYKP